MKKNILLLTNELTEWYYACRYTYEGNFGIEEGFTSQNLSYITVPVFLYSENTIWEKWQEVIIDNLQNYSFDQIWFEIGHANYTEKFADFIKHAAPLRIGYQVESFVPDPYEFILNPKGTEGRVKRAEKNRQLATHIIAVDEHDVDILQSDYHIPAFWWCGLSIPEKYIADEIRPHSSKEAYFFGTPYGHRRKWLTHDSLKSLLKIGSSAEDRTSFPQKYNQLIKLVETYLTTDQVIDPLVFNKIIDGIRSIRKATYPIWLRSLSQGSAVINLPQFAHAYASRVKQGMAVGAPVISWRIPDRPKTEKLFIDGQDILLYSADSPEELAAHIRQIQADKEYSNWIANNGLQKLKKYHTTERFVKNVQNWLVHNIGPDYGIEKGSIISHAPKKPIINNTKSDSNENSKDGIKMKDITDNNDSSISREIPKAINKVSYIHIPKTGGTYLAQLESQTKPVIEPMNYLGHCYIVNDLNVINPIDDLPGRDMNRVVLKNSLGNSIIFSTVRNIFDWLVSYYFHAGGFNPKYCDPNHYDYINANKGFDYLLNVIANREEPWPNRKFIYFQLFTDNGEFLPDWLNRTHSLDEDLAHFAKEFGVGYAGQASQRIGRKGKEKDYRTYYTDKLVSLVYETWKRELNLYGFEFETLENDKGLVGRKVDQSLKDQIRYNYKSDLLSIGGKITETGIIKNGENTYEELLTRQLIVKNDPIRLHLGCGEEYFEGYINIDYPPEDHNVMEIKADYYADITKLNFPDNSVDEIRLHHVFEHFPRVTALALLIRWQKWLKIGGQLYIETPDFEGSIKTFLSNPKWTVKTGIIRHLTGDQSAFWGYHIEQWFPERFERTLSRLGFTNIQTKSVSWSQEPFLSNVHVIAKKIDNLSIEQLIKNAESILWESTVSPLEKPSHDVWCDQLREIVANGGSVSTPFQKIHPGNAIMSNDTQNQSEAPETLYIGIKYYGHDSAIFSIDPAHQVQFGLATERVTRYKHDTLFPIPALNRMIAYKEIDPTQIKKIHLGSCFICQGSEKLPIHVYEQNLLERELFNAPYVKDFETKLAQFHKMPDQEKLEVFSSPVGNKYLQITEDQTLITLDQHFENRLAKIFPNATIELSHFDHEYCHAVSAYYSSPFETALVFAFDGYGDDQYFSRVYHVERGEFKEIGNSRSDVRALTFKSSTQSVTHECSIGGLYSYFTYLLGFRPDSDEGKVEALAAFGQWNNDLFNTLNGLVSLDKNGSIKIDHRATEQELSLDKMETLLQKMKKEDVAAAIQKFLEKILLQYVSYYIEKTGIRKICLSGGVAANVIANMHINDELAEEIFITPAMADDGAAQGAAILSLLENGYSYNELKWLQAQVMPYWGTAYSQDDVERAVDEFSSEITVVDRTNDWPELVAEFITHGEVGAIFQGRMEWGPRALGNRSIVADVRDPEIQNKINGQIKNRPWFQPFCPSILEEEREQLFEHAYSNKHMTIAFKMKPEFREILPGAIHVDGTARAQFVSEEDNLNYYRLIKKVKEITGYGVILNTSFNKHGRTIVESPKDAIRDFLDTNMDFLVLEGYICRRIRKKHRSITRQPMPEMVKES